jgi:hypothetical protein
MTQPSHGGSLSTERISKGYVDYVEDGRSIPFWCRTGAGDVLVYIYRPVANEWQSKYSWALDRKQEITDMIVAYLRPKFPPFRVTFDTEAIIALKKVDEKVG